MKRNGGIVGPLKVFDQGDAISGTFDAYDVYNYRKNDVWSITKKLISTSSSIINGGSAIVGATYEGDTVEFNATFEGFLDGDQVYAIFETVSGSITTADFTDGQTLELLTVTSNQTSFQKTITFDSTSEGDDVYRIAYSLDSNGNNIIGYSANFTIYNNTFSITPSTSNVNEGDTVTFNISATGISAGRNLYWDIVEGGGFLSSDFIDTSLSGSVSVTGDGLGNGTASFSKTLVNDFTTEGSESFTVSLRANSIFGPILDQATVTINDTSQTPTATITPSTLTPSEGQSVTVNVATTNVPDGTTLYMTVENVSNGEPADDFDTSEFTVSITSGSGSNTIATIADGYTEGSEQFVIRARLDSYAGTIIGSSSTITISDTSTGTPEPQGEDLSSSFFSIAEFVNSDGAADTTSNYSVSEVQSSYSGTGRLYLIHKSAPGTTSDSSFYYDAPVACIQVLNDSGTVVNQQWWFGTSGNPAGWETYTAELNLGTSGISLTPSQAATNYTYTAIGNGATVGRFTLATSTSSDDTGAADGIAEPTGPMTLGEKTMVQSVGTYYMYREMSGGNLDRCVLGRSTSRTWSGGERIRIAYIIGNRPTAGVYDANDTFFVGIA